MNVVELHEARALAALGHEVDLITRRSDPEQPDEVGLGPGVTLRHLTAGPETRLAKSAIDQYVPEFTAALAELAGRRYDLVHSQHWMSGAAALPLARAWGVPHVQSYHSVAARPDSALSEGEPPESPARVPGEALLARESDLVVAISAAEARTVIERCGADPNRVAIVPPGVDAELFRPRRPGDAAPDPARLAELAPHGRGFAVFAARLQPLKAPDLAVAALAHVPEPIRPDLVIAGADSPDFADYTAKLHRLIAELNLEDSVNVIGPQDRAELAWLLREAVLCLVPSHSETFGLVALEAAASGTPVVAAAAGGLREAVVHGESGQLMDSRQPADWGVAMTKLLARPATLARMGVVARVHARRFTWATMASTLSTLYEGLLPKPAVPSAVLADPSSAARRGVWPGGPAPKAGSPRGDGTTGHGTTGHGTTGRGTTGTAQPGVILRDPSPVIPRDPTPVILREVAESRGRASGQLITPAAPGGTSPGARILFVHAHPDDETLSTGAAILALRRRGAEPIVVTATRGELGEVTPCVVRRVGCDGLTAYRVAERTNALAELGACDAGFLGDGANRAPGREPRRYSDSGMAWVTPTLAGPAPESPPEALSRAPLDEVAADIGAVARRWRADVIVSYDAQGGYGHPDHVRCHYAAAQAALELGLPFWGIVERGEGDGGEAEAGGTMTGEAISGEATDGEADSDEADSGEVFSVGPDLDRLIAAHRAYRSQFTLDAAGETLVHVGGQPDRVATTVALRRV
jgi:D-inositol-3-phosphate glycosyltransferase